MNYRNKGIKTQVQLNRILMSTDTPDFGSAEFDVANSLVERVLRDPIEYKTLELQSNIYNAACQVKKDDTHQRLRPGEITVPVKSLIVALDKAIKTMAQPKQQIVKALYQVTPEHAMKLIKSSTMQIEFKDAYILIGASRTKADALKSVAPEERYKRIMEDPDMAMKFEQLENEMSEHEVSVFFAYALQQMVFKTAKINSELLSQFSHIVDSKRPATKQVEDILPQIKDDPQVEESKSTSIEVSNNGTQINVQFKPKIESSSQSKLSESVGSPTSVLLAKYINRGTKKSQHKSKIEEQRVAVTSTEKKTGMFQKLLNKFK